MSKITDAMLNGLRVRDDGLTYVELEKLYQAECAIDRPNYKQEKKEVMNNQVVSDNRVTTEKRYVDIKGLSMYIGVKIPTIRDWIRDGTIPICRLPGSRLIRFNLDLIDEWLEQKQLKQK